MLCAEFLKCRVYSVDILCQYFYVSFSALTLLVERQEVHLACKKLSGVMLVWLYVWVKVQICIWPS